MNRVILVLVLFGSVAAASEPYVYPAKGQSAEEQKQDQFECYQWAAEQSGFDPVTSSGDAPSSAADVGKPRETSDSGGAGKSALGGAAKGAAIAEVSDGDAGKGAAAGATMGLIRGKRESRQQRAQEEQQKAAAAERARVEAAAKQRELRANYERANAACLEGRGYVVR